MGPLCRETVTAGQIPSTRVAGGEGRRWETQKGSKPHLFVALGEEAADRSGSLDYQCGILLLGCRMGHGPRPTSVVTTHYIVGLLIQ
jgi:hypothetical protein